MIISTLLYRKKRDEINRHIALQTLKSTTTVFSSEGDNAMGAFLMFLIFLFLIEIIIFIYVVKTIIACSHSPIERISHGLIALFFPIPYLIYAFVSDCANPSNK
jgi:hypothetical protein